MRYADACRILDVPAGAGADELKKAYRKQARLNHPDANPGDPDAALRFAQATEAFELLKDTAKLTQPAAATSPAAMNRPPWPSGREPLSAAQHGIDVTGNLHVTLAEAFSGTVTDITFDDADGCEHCGATGAEPGTAWMPCPPCRTMPRADCQWCAGEGSVPEDVCRACRGAGAFPRQRTVRVTVPRSADDGQSLLVRGKGCWGVQTRGNLRLTLKIDEPGHMRRLGDDVEIDLDVDVVQAVLGGTADVPGLDAQTYKIAISPGSCSGKRYRLRGHGMYLDRDGDQRGDLFAVVSVLVPDPAVLTDRERWLYEQLLEEQAKRVSGA